MNKAIVDRLEKLLDEGDKASDVREIGLWSQKVIAFLKSALGPSESEIFEKLRDYIDDWKQHAMRIGHLQGLIAKEEAQTTAVPAATLTSGTASAAPLDSVPSTNSRKVFVVHGHDNEAKETTARFLEKLALQPIILHEQPSSGRTVIEKFENYSDDIAFAVVLLTPDDVGAVKTSSGSLKSRARQNVIMELGYFMGRLGRVRVCALHKGGVELPSDYQGILYIEMDAAGAWKAKLAQEFVQAKLPIDLSGLLGG